MADTYYSMSTIDLSTMLFSTFSAQFINLSGFIGDPAAENKAVSLTARQLYAQIEQQFRLQFSDSLTEYLNRQLQVNHG